MRAESGRAPFGILVAAGAALMVVVAMVAALLFPDRDTVGRLTAVAVAAGVYAAVVADTRAVLITAGLGYLLFDGFLVNRFGDLTWDGTTSAWYLTVFVLAVGLGLGQRRIRDARDDRALDDHAPDEELDDPVERDNRSMKETHGG